MNLLLISIGKLIGSFSKLFNIGSGSTWPGHVALSIKRNFIGEMINNNPKLKIILIAGTNGKTTTGKLIQTILEKSGRKVFQNESGANLLNGIASTLIRHSNKVGIINYGFAIFEVDENTLPLILKEITPNYLILLNLFRDQLDRYGEVNAIANKWKKAIDGLSEKTKLVLNADDPQIAHLARHSGEVDASTDSRIRFHQGDERFWTSQNDGFDRKILYFGLNDKKLAQTKNQHAVDSTYCPSCGAKLFYKTMYYSHLGIWHCNSCGAKRPRVSQSQMLPSRLTGIYNFYNVLAATLVVKEIGIPQEDIEKALEEFNPAFGRQEVLNVNRKKVQIFLSKNPTSFNESLRTVAGLGAKHLLLVLNDRIPDGRDVSWIWDVDFEDYIKKFRDITISGDRAFDMGLRIKYSCRLKFSIFNFQFSMKNSNLKFQIEENLDKAINSSLEKTSKSETLYILPTYSAMLEVRKILTGKKIL